MKKSKKLVRKIYDWMLSDAGQTENPTLDNYVKPEHARPWKLTAQEGGYGGFDLELEGPDGEFAKFYLEVHKGMPVMHIGNSEDESIAHVTVTPKGMGIVLDSSKERFENDIPEGCTIYDRGYTQEIFVRSEARREVEA